MNAAALSKGLSWLSAAVLALLLFELPYVILGEAAPIRVHDTLEPILSLHAAQQFPGSAARDGVLPFLLGGLPTFAVADTPMVGFLHEQLPMVWAYRLCELTLRLVGVVGMLLFLRRRYPDGPMSLIWLVSVAFATGPYWVAAGASATAAPLFAWSLMVAGDPNASHLKRTGAMASVAVLPWTLSLPYVGIFLMPLGGIYWAVRATRNHHPEWRLLAALSICGASFLLANRQLVLQTLSTSAPVWQRAEFSLLRDLTQTQLLQKALSIATQGHYNAPTNTAPALVGIVAMLAAAISVRRDPSFAMARLRSLLVLGAASLAIAASYYAYHEHWLIDVKARFGLAKLNLGRSYQLYPAICYLILFHGLWSIARWGRPALVAAGCAATLQIGLNVGRADWVDPLGDPPYSAYRASEVFEQAIEAIGREPSSYKIGCLGVFPSQAHLNRLHTVDGYWYLYPLEYKHRLRRAIAPELSKSEVIRSYFDDFGSRAYLMSAELGKRFLIPKHEAKPLSGWEPDMSALKELGTEYIFSAVPLVEPSRLGLRLVGSFSAPEAFIDLHVYELQ